MYMMYTVSEFRQSTRKILDDVDSGKRVSLKRYDKVYQILPTDLKVVEKSGVQIIKLEPSTKTPPIISESTSSSVRPASSAELQASAERLQNGTCNVHGVPLDARGKCLQKGCKNA